MQPSRPFTFARLFHRLSLGAVLASLLGMMPAVASAQDYAQVTTATAQLFSGASPIATLKKGQLLHVESTKSPWVRVKGTIDGRTQSGWIRESQLRLYSAEQGGVTSSLAGSTRSMLRVTAASTDMKEGKETTGTLKHGEIRKFDKVEGAWYFVVAESGKTRGQGWVPKQAIELVEETNCRPSIAGHVPFSVHEANVFVDWAAEQVTLQIPLPLETVDSSVSMSRPSEFTTDSLVPTLSVADDLVSLTVDSNQLLDYVTPGTRSLWIRESDRSRRRSHRVDLPAPQLKTGVSAASHAAFANGLILTIPVTGLLPGYVVEYATLSEFGTDQDFRPMSRAKGAMPRLARTSKSELGDQLRFGIRAPLAGEGELFLFVRVRNPDGSQSGTLRVRLTANAQPKATEVTPLKLAPVDSSCELPGLELLTVNAAKTKLVNLGLKPKLIETSTWKPLTLDAVPGDWLVLRQGVGAGERVRVGESVLLAVSQQQAWNTASYTSSGTLSQRAATVEVNSRLGFVGLRKTGANPNLASARRNVNLAVAAANDVALASRELLQQASLPLRTDPGVYLYPDKAVDHRRSAALLELTLDALLNLPDWQNLPGPIGRSITRAIRDCEGKIYPDVKSPPDLIALDRLEQVIAGELKIRLPALAETELRRALREFATRYPNSGAADRNGNRCSSDDLALFVVEWLFENGYLNPSVFIRIEETIDGSPLALLDNGANLSANSSSFFKLSDESPLVFPGQVAPQTPSLKIPASPPVAQKPTNKPQGQAGGNPVPAGTAPTATIVEGKPVVTLQVGPDLVRVPQVVNQPMSLVQKRVADRGLKIAGTTNLFATDQVTQVSPQEDTWAKLGSTLDLRVVRPVPDITKRSRREAERELQRHGLMLALPADTTPQDVVLEQTPNSGELIEIGGSVRVKLAVIVPDLVGKLRNSAIQALQEFSLRWRSDSKSFPTDKVIDQFPVPGMLVDRQDEVLLTLYVKTPNLIGLPLSNAQLLITQNDLQTEVGTQLAQANDVVRGQQPNSGSYVPHGSSVLLGPIIGIVPDVRGSSVLDGKNLLEGVAYPVRVVSNALGEDLVTAQLPPPNTEYERGQTVTLDVRVRTPNVVGQPVRDAVTTVANSLGKLQVQMLDDAIDSDVVQAQDPAPNQIVFPRTTISLVPGVVVPNVRGLAPANALQAFQVLGLPAEIVNSSTQESVDRTLIGSVVISDQRPVAGVYRRRDVNGVQLATIEFVLAVRVVPDVIRHGVNVAAAVATIRQAQLTPIVILDGRQVDLSEFQIYATAISLRQPGTDMFRVYPSRQAPLAGTVVPALSPVAIEVTTPAPRFDPEFPNAGVPRQNPGVPLGPMPNGGPGGAPGGGGGFF